MQSLSTYSRGILSDSILSMSCFDHLSTCWYFAMSFVIDNVEQINTQSLQIYLINQRILLKFLKYKIVHLYTQILITIEVADLLPALWYVCYPYNGLTSLNYFLISLDNGNEFIWSCRSTYQNDNLYDLT